MRAPCAAGTAAPDRESPALCPLACAMRLLGSMKTSLWVALGVISATAMAAVSIALAFHRDIAAARQRVATGSIAATRCGPIEYAV
jgi:hypothetical protein